MKYVYYLISSSMIFLVFSMPVQSQQGAYDSGSGTKSVYTLESIVVTAAKIDEYIENHPQHVVTLDAGEIRERNFLEIGEALDSMPGVDVRPSGSEPGARISIRGSGGSGSVLILLNGRPINSSQYGGVSLGSIPIDTVSRITVFKPPIPVWLGPGGSAGAINIVTATSDVATSGNEKRKKTKLKISGGSFGIATASCSMIAPRKQGSIMVTAGSGHKDGKRTNSDRDSGYLSLHWDKKSDLIQHDLNGRYYHSRHGSSGPIDNPTPDARQYYNKGALDFRIKGLTRKTGEFDFKTYMDVENLKDRSQTGDESTLDVYKVGIKNENTWTREDGLWALRLGGIAEYNAVDHTLSGNHDRDNVSIYTQFDRDLGDFTLTFGLRSDYTSDFGFFPAITAGLSHIFGTGSSSLKINAGYCVKVPTFSQLYQPSHGSIDQVRGNPDLSEQKVYSYDFGFEHKFKSDHIFEAVLFRADTENLIAHERGTDLIYRPKNIDRAYRQGVEISFKYKFVSGASMDISYIIQHSHNSETGGELTYAPRHKAKITGKITLEPKTRVEATLRAVSDQYSDLFNSDSGKLDAYRTMDLKIIQPICLESHSLEIFVHIQNLFDTDFEIHHGYPDDGFRFIGGLNLAF